MAHTDAALTRDQVLDTLWPEAGQTAAANSLNQTVFQLRGSFAPEYRDGEAPLYIISNAELVSVQPGLIITDLEDFRRLSHRAAEAITVDEWQGSVSKAIELVKGEFLTELKYEDWVADLQAGIHAEIRQALLPIARGGGRYGNDDLASGQRQPYSHWTNSMKRLTSRSRIASPRPVVVSPLENYSPATPAGCERNSTTSLLRN